MATHSRILAWKMPQLEKPGGCKQSDTTERLSTYSQTRDVIPKQQTLNMLFPNFLGSFGLFFFLHQWFSARSSFPPKVTWKCLKTFQLSHQGACCWYLRVEVIQSCLFGTLWTIQSMEFSRPEYWSGYPLPSPGDLPKLGIEPRSPALQADSLPAEPQENKDAPHHPAMQRTAPLQ